MGVLDVLDLTAGFQGGDLFESRSWTIFFSRCKIIFQIHNSSRLLFKNESVISYELILTFSLYVDYLDD